MIFTMETFPQQDQYDLYSPSPNKRSAIACFLNYNANFISLNKKKANDKRQLT